MNKLIFIILLVMVLLTGVFLGFNLLNQGQRVENSIGNGTVLEVSDSSVLIQGYLISPTEQKKVIKVTFTIDKNTVFKKTTMVVDVKKHSDGEPFKPELMETQGNLSEIKKGTNIVGVKTYDLLKNDGTAKASEIHYKGVLFNN